MQVSLDNGATWATATTSVGSNTWSLATTLTASNTLRVRVTDTAGNSGTAASQAYVLDTTAPTTTISTIAFSADTGSSGTDFITNTAAQTISGTTSANMVAGEIVQVSLDNGATWATATTSVGSNTWSLATTLTASNTLRVRVTDTAGNSGTAASQAYVLDTTAPTTTISTIAFSADTGSSGTDFITTPRRKPSRAPPAPTWWPGKSCRCRWTTEPPGPPPPPAWGPTPGRWPPH
ncbi:MAG: Ig-like domain repeat protein [Ramlibacter sp.]|nr:Ig-like domain repeat protein [Ramlibacter sp.]